MAVAPQFDAKCAIRFGIRQFEKILQTAGDINVPGPKGRSALFLAARAGRFEHVRLLLEKGADPNLTDESDEAPLQAASRYGHLECVAEVIRAGAIVNRCPDPSKTDYCETALYSAVVHQRNAVAVYLLQCGADPNLSASGRRLPLNAAAWRGEAEICRHLVHAGAVINACDARGSTALGGALRRGTVETVQALLDLGADPNLKEERGDRPLTIAMRREVGECLPFVQALVASKADIFATNDDGSTAADWALKMERWKAARYLESLGARPTPDEELPQPTTSFEDGATMEVIACRVITHDPSDDDRKEAAILQKLPLTFLRGATWEVSPAHWALLKCLTTPLTLDRAAYFVRGYRNAPKGTELLDGPIVLGESYLDAVERFVGFGLVRRLTVSELVGLNSTGEELSKIARGHKFSLPTHKNDKVPAFISALPDIAEEIASRKTWYQTTESGSSLIQNSHWKPDKALVAEYLRLIYDALLDKQIESAFQYRFDLRSLAGQRVPRHLTEHAVMTVRRLIFDPWPSKALAPESDQLRLRVVSAFWNIVPSDACKIAMINVDDWDVFGPLVAPRFRENPLTVRELVDGFLAVRVEHPKGYEHLADYQFP